MQHAVEQNIQNGLATANKVLAYVSTNDQSTVSCINNRAGDSSSVVDVSRSLYMLASFVTNLVLAVKQIPVASSDSFKILYNYIL